MHSSQPPIVTDGWLRKIGAGRICKLAKLKQTLAMKLKLDPKKVPIMAPALELEIEAALVQYIKRPKWIEWGMDGLRKQGNLIILHGPPGTGKTTIAQYMSKRVGQGMTTLNMKDVGGKAPGQTERMVNEVFGSAQASRHTLFMDECEAILWDRGRAGSDSMWMVGVIDELLMWTAKYKYLIVAATNRSDILDNAFLDRAFASLQVGLPEAPERVRLWRQKMPDRFPLKLTQVQIEQLSEIILSGRQIENAIVREASMAIQQEREPSFQSLMNIAKALLK